MKTKLTVEEAANKVVYALHKAGFKREQVFEIFQGLYHGKEWNDFDLARSIMNAYELTGGR